MRIINYLKTLSVTLALLSFDAQAKKNGFGVNPPVRTAEAIVVPTEIPQVSLQGVMTILGPRQGLLKI